jgi:hypothetical protein
MVLSALLSTPSPPPDAFHDSALQTLVVVIITLLGTLIQILYTFIMRERREITYEKTFDESLPTHSQGISLVHIKMWNSGNSPIDRDDFDKQIIVDFKGRKILACDILSQEPDNILDQDELKTFFKIQPELDKVTLAKFMFDLKDVLTIQAVVVGGRGDIHCKARIKHRGKMKGLNKRFVVRKMLLALVLLGFVSCIFLLRTFSIYFSEETHIFSTPDVVMLIIFIYSNILIMFYAIVRRFSIIRIRNI